MGACAVFEARPAAMRTGRQVLEQVDPIRAADEVGALALPALLHHAVPRRPRRPPARHQALVRVQPHVVRGVLDGVEGGGLGGGRLGAEERPRDVGVLRRAEGGCSDVWWQGRVGWLDFWSAGPGWWLDFWWAGPGHSFRGLARAPSPPPPHRTSHSASAGRRRPPSPPPRRPPSGAPPPPWHPPARRAASCRRPPRTPPSDP